jgi:hypothetical protein
MNHSKLILSDLEEALVFWEDLVAVASLQKKIKQTGDKNLQRILAANIDFSEQSIKHPEKLRMALQNRESFNSSEFLPSVPDDATSWLDKINYMRGAGLNLPATFFFPYIIAHWIKIKKVFRLESDALIKPINPSKANYLHLLPCDSFVINFVQPIEIGFETSPLIKRYKSCIVARSGNLVDTFWIPVNLESKSLRPSGKKLLKSIFKNGKVNEKHLRQFTQLITSMNWHGDPPQFTRISFRDDRPLVFCTRMLDLKNVCLDYYYDLENIGTAYHEENGKFSQVPTDIENTPGIRDSQRFHQFFFELLNGFCYMLSEIKPRKPKVVENSKETQNDQFSQKLVWNEIPITKVDYLEQDENDTDEITVAYGSGEKSPHLRRGHWRHILKKDGSTEKIWIKQIMVREDKLDEEDLKGNVTVLKEKRVVV